jgi:hypothetical protein
MASKSPFNRPRPPRVVHICGQKVIVRVVSHLEADNCELIGAFNSETKTIFLTKGCDWKSVLLHELVHALLYFTGASEGLGHSKEESIVLAIEHGLTPLFLK